MENLKSNLISFSQDQIRETVIQKTKDGGYSTFEEKDNKLNAISEFCFLYLYNDKLPDQNTVNFYLNFLANEYTYLTNMKEKLKLKHYCWALTEFEQSVNEFILSENADSLVHETVTGKMSKDISTALEKVILCNGILHKINKEINSKIM